MNTIASSQLRSSSRPNQRAVALLLTLVAVISVAGAVGALYIAAVQTSLQSTVHNRERNARVFLHACDDVIASWLTTASQHVVLPADSASPRVLVMDEEIAMPLPGHNHNDPASRFPVRLVIHAFDQQGMLPIGDETQPASLHRLLEPDVQVLLRRTRERSDQPLGIDTLHALAERQPRLPLRMYPSIDDRDGLSVAEVLATHNPIPASIFQSDITGPARIARSVRAQTGSIPLNIHTCPPEILAAAMREEGVNFLAPLTEARDAGRTMTPPEHARRESSAGRSRFTFVESSQCWAFRIDIMLDILVESWWVVYAQHDGDWYKVQQLAIP